MFKFIYILFEKKLETLREYLIKNRKKIYKKILIINRIFDSLCT
jgi:hypothetical protein